MNLSLRAKIACRNQNHVDKLCGRISGIYLISFVCLLPFLLALTFAFSKTKMLKLLFFLLVIKQLLGHSTLDIDIYLAKQSVIQLGKAEWW